MDRFTWLAIFSGFFFGIWPIIMKQSGLNGSTSALLFEGVALLIILPVSMWQGVTITETQWWFGVAAGAIAGVGIILFNHALAGVPHERTWSVILIMLVVQNMVPAIHCAIATRHLDLKTGLGLLTAVATALLLG